MNPRWAHTRLAAGLIVLMGVGRSARAQFATVNSNAASSSAHTGSPLQGKADVQVPYTVTRPECKTFNPDFEDVKAVNEFLTTLRNGREGMMLSNGTLVQPQVQKAIDKLRTVKQKAMALNLLSQYRFYALAGAANADSELARRMDNWESAQSKVLKEATALNLGIDEISKLVSTLSKFVQVYAAMKNPLAAQLINNAGLAQQLDGFLKSQFGGEYEKFKKLFEERSVFLSSVQQLIHSVEDVQGYVGKCKACTPDQKEAVQRFVSGETLKASQNARVEAEIFKAHGEMAAATVGLTGDIISGTLLSLAVPGSGAVVLKNVGPAVKTALQAASFSKKLIEVAKVVTPAMAVVGRSTIIATGVTKLGVGVLDANTYAGTNAICDIAHTYNEGPKALDVALMAMLGTGAFAIGSATAPVLAGVAAGGMMIGGIHHTIQTGRQLVTNVQAMGNAKTQAERESIQGGTNSLLGDLGGTIVGSGIGVNAGKKIFTGALKGRALATNSTSASTFKISSGGKTRTVEHFQGSTDKNTRALRRMTNPEIGDLVSGTALPNLKKLNTAVGHTHADVATSLAKKAFEKNLMEDPEFLKYAEQFSFYKGIEHVWERIPEDVAARIVKRVHDKAAKEFEKDWNDYLRPFLLRDKELRENYSQLVASDGSAAHWLQTSIDKSGWWREAGAKAYARLNKDRDLSKPRAVSTPSDHKPLMEKQQVKAVLLSDLLNQQGTLQKSKRLGVPLLDENLKPMLDKNGNPLLSPSVDLVAIIRRTRQKAPTSAELNDFRMATGNPKATKEDYWIAQTQRAAKEQLLVPDTPAGKPGLSDIEVRRLFHLFEVGDIHAATPRKAEQVIGAHHQKNPLVSFFLDAPDAGAEGIKDAADAAVISKLKNLNPEVQSMRAHNQATDRMDNNFGIWDGAFKNRLRARIEKKTGKTELKQGFKETKSGDDKKMSLSTDNDANLDEKDMLEIMPDVFADVSRRATAQKIKPLRSVMVSAVPEGPLGLQRRLNPKQQEELSDVADGLIKEILLNTMGGARQEDAYKAFGVFVKMDMYGNKKITLIMPSPPAPGEEPAIHPNLERVIRANFEKLLSQPKYKEKGFYAFPILGEAARSRSTFWNGMNRRRQ